MSFKGFSIFSSGRHSVQASRTILAILVGHWRNTSVQTFWNQAIGQGRDVVWRFSFFLALVAVLFNGGKPLQPSWRFPVDTILAHFDPEVILLLQSKFLLKTTKGLGRDAENWFSRWQLLLKGNNFKMGDNSDKKKKIQVTFHSWGIHSKH